MVWTVSGRSSLNVATLVDQIIANGAMNREEHLQLTSAILADHKITEEERRQINRVFDYIQNGRLRLVD
ncbi:hypothetical protein H6G89_11610 [Oscillatoria sp. FACHB-1407]|uniref:hypothetical protein n=1 Tax=Oscillatoria sp. FACHB-1407 TaxID=2692847 RepID=UPI001684A91B|nr:hypothetical protein [Oscillatoria sp. FACHB-1407]MBD2461698.1 hypothetical protein [Oscillatoria sp. FACHB-1407]